MKHLDDILQAARVEIIRGNTSHLHDNDEDAMVRTMQMWLGLTPPKNTASSAAADDDDGDDFMLTSTTITVEDSLPLSPSVYHAMVDWLVDAWNNNNDNSNSSSLFSAGAGRGPSNNPLVLLDSNSSSRHRNHDYDAGNKDDDSDDDGVTLEKAFDSIRATKWLRVLLEFNLVGYTDTATTNEDNDDTSLLSRCLLQVDVQEQPAASTSSSSDHKDDNNEKEVDHAGEDDDQNAAAAAPSSYVKISPRNALLRALFQHIQALPDIQQHLYSYSQHLQRAQPLPSKNNNNNRIEDPHTMVVSGRSGPLQDPTSRLKQYEHAIAVSNRLQTEWQEHVDRLEIILLVFYRTSNVEQRKLIRRLLGHAWSSYSLAASTNHPGTAMVTGGGTGLRQENTRAAAMALTLHVLKRILLGTQHGTIITPVLEHLLNEPLVNLHKVNGMVLWRDQTAVLELYHEPLCQCIGMLLKRDPTRLVPHILPLLLDKSVFPLAGNTPKQVLLLHEMDTYIQLLPAPPATEEEEDDRSSSSNNNMHDSVADEVDPMRSMMQALSQTLARCMSSEHSRVAERALQFFQNANFEFLVQKYLSLCLRIFLPSLVRREPSWNPTVRKMTYHVLRKLQDYNEDEFASACNRLFFDREDAAVAAPEGLEADSPREAESASTAGGGSVLPDNLGMSKLVSEQKVQASATRSMKTATSDFSLKAGMGSWKPPGSMPPPSSRPPGGRLPSGRSQPTQQQQQPGRGRAPWASGAPPLTVTGVAPWAMQQPPPPQQPHLSRHKRPLNGITEDDKNDKDDEGNKPKHIKCGLSYVLDQMAKLKPPHEEDGISKWSRAQMAETPTYLPTLKFHDLVFGHDLGSGAFGYVRYARLINKGLPRSQWDEYAVKVVSTEKIRTMGYEASVQREIAVLRVLSHPGIARLVSSFRFHDGAYLVLEYASRGDLHTLLQKHGSLDLDSTRFVIGEVVAALASIHEMGFVFGDLKPENVVITEPGHIKLTDFGGCRAVTAEAKTLIRSVSKNILKNLRDGDWKTRQPSESSNSNSESHQEIDDGWNSSGDAMEEDSTVGREESNQNQSEVEEDDIDGSEDLRIEGTTAYLPPEVVMGAFPTVSADSWALGCVMYQCLSGRPPLLEADDDATRNRIVSFDVGGGECSGSNSSSRVDSLFRDKHASGISKDAREMISSLLDRNVSQRPAMAQLAEHAFFAACNVFELYNLPPYPLDVGTVAPSPNAQWSRRQFSSIWAPQPEAYNLTDDDDNNGLGHSVSFSGALTDAPIMEGDEACGFFTPSGKLHTTATNSLIGARMGRVLLPPS